MRSQVESSVRPVASICWPPVIIASTGPVSGHGYTASWPEADAEAPPPRPPDANRPPPSTPAATPATTMTVVTAGPPSAPVARPTVAPRALIGRPPCGVPVARDPPQQAQIRKTSLDDSELVPPNWSRVLTVHVTSL